MPAELDIIAAENRRLLREVKELRARVTALESSRWWRVHPRFLVRRLRARVARRDRSDSPNEAPARPDAPRPASDQASVARFRDEVVARGSFRSDMVSGGFPTWEPFLKELEGRSAGILEIGSFEGMSACYFLWRLPDARLTCIDTFAGGASFAALGKDVSGLEAAFDRNVALVDGSRVRKLVGNSADHLLELVRERRQFDLVFLDGSDLALDVLVDAALSWQLLAPGGLMIFDNYLWRSPLGEDPLFHPAPAIEAFIELVGDHCEVLVKEAQVILRRAARPAPDEIPANAATPAPL
jgi:predicted O-methyltransferase YrrM